MTTPNLGLALAAAPDTIAQALITKFNGNFSSLDTIIGNKVDKGSPITNLITTTAVAAGVPLVAKGILLQSANLFEARDSSDTVKASIDPVGIVTGNSVYTTTLDVGSVGLTAGGTTKAAIKATAASDKVLILKGAASQSGNLLEAQNSSAGILNRINQLGQQFIVGTSSQGVDGAAWLGIAITGTADKGIAIRGASGQTGNLQEWQDPVGGVLVRSRAAGAFEFNWGLYTQGPINNTPGAGHMQIDNTGTNGATTAIGLLIIGRAAQSANLIEVRNSAGTPMTGFMSDGRLYISSANIGTYTTANTNAGGSALPALAKFFAVNIDGTVFKVPYYAV